jgi:hypothetical protein
MNARKPIVVVGGTIILAAGVILSLRSGLPSPTIRGRFTPEEVRQIELAVRNHRLSLLRFLVSKHRFRMAFDFCTDVGLGSLDEIGPNISPAVRVSRSITNSMGAYLITRGRCPVRYELEGTTTGWKVAVVAFPAMKASNKRMQ